MNYRLFLGWLSLACAGCGNMITTTSAAGGTGGATTGSTTPATTGSTVSTTGGGGSGPVLCHSDGDCPAGSVLSNLCNANDACINGHALACNGDTAVWAPMSCSIDSDCEVSGLPPQTFVCRQCGDGVGACDLACQSDAQCGPGATCAAGGHCTATPCTTNGQCPEDFECSTSDGFCVRQTCSSDVQCVGYCVAGHCAGSLGVCSGAMGTCT
jgi:hypothetical protein